MLKRLLQTQEKFKNLLLTLELLLQLYSDQIIYETEEYIVDDNIYEETFTDTRDVQVEFQDTRTVYEEFQDTRDIEVPRTVITQEEVLDTDYIEENDLFLEDGIYYSISSETETYETTETRDVETEVEFTDTRIVETERGLIVEVKCDFCLQEWHELVAFINPKAMKNDETVIKQLIKSNKKEKEDGKAEEE